MSRYPMATWRPTSKHGYENTDFHLHQGLVIHSAEGSLAGLFSVLDGSRQASWHFSVAQDGRVFQHVDTANIAWTNGSQDSNTRFWGIECEGGGPGNSSEPLTELQYQALVRVVRWLWGTHGLTGYIRQQTLWEHNEMTRFGAASTSCPSGRIPWQRLIADLEEDMTDEQWKLLQDTHHHVHVLIPELLRNFEKREVIRYAQLRRDIAAGGGGTSLKQVLTDIVRRLKP